MGRNTWLMAAVFLPLFCLAAAPPLSANGPASKPSECEHVERVGTPVPPMGQEGSKAAEQPARDTVTTRPVAGTGAAKPQASAAVAARKEAGKDSVAASQSFDMNELIERLKKTKAIGFLTKLALRADAMELIEMVKRYRKEDSPEELQQLRARFEGLLLKVLALLDDDPQLRHDIVAEREQIWQSLLEVKT